MEKISVVNINSEFIRDRLGNKTHKETTTVKERKNNNNGDNFTDDGLFILDENYVNEEFDLYGDLKISSAKINNKYLYEKDASAHYSLKIVHPELQKAMDLLVKRCADEGIPIRITSDVRSVQEQNGYYYGGSSNAIGDDYQSYHQWGLAFDVCINIKGAAYDVELLKRVGEIGKSLGLEWGGDWEKFVDMPPFQLKEFGGDVDYLKEMYGNPAIFADTWTFSEDDIRYLEEKYGVTMDELVNSECIVWESR